MVWYIEDPAVLHWPLTSDTSNKEQRLNKHYNMPSLKEVIPP